MAIEDYKKRVTPAKRRSRLEPYTKEILAMVAEGYSLKQIAAGLWLEYQVKIGTTALWEFIGRRSKLSADDLEKPTTAKVNAPGPAAPATPSPPANQPGGTSGGGKTVKVGKFEINRTASQFRKGDK